ncbi:MAG: MFS transporter [Sphingobacteriales bacterium JAD_PAG50586_3]|nr:MAG: MFS transporter [Sphingobacteriales bacterium JAD_PAG50586_3]
MRVPFVRWGYWLSAIARPLLAIFTFPAWIFGARTLDMLGKGVRTTARDALLSDEATSKTKGAIFGFHRTMDTLGAVIGPLLALLYLYYYHNSYRNLYFIAFIPAVLAGISVLWLKEKRRQTKAKKQTPSLKSAFRYLKDSPAEYKKLIIGLLLFTLFNSSNAFLILKVKASGVSDTTAISVYVFYNLIYALASYPGGLLADKIGMKPTFVIGLLLFVAVYFGMVWNENLIGFYILFFLYGIFMAFTEGVAKAWISNIAAKEDTGKALGLYLGFNSFFTLAASSIAGLLWAKINPQAPFMLTAIMTGGVILYFLIVVKTIRKKSHNLQHTH